MNTGLATSERARPSLATVVCHMEHENADEQPSPRIDRHVDAVLRLCQWIHWPLAHNTHPSVLRQKLQELGETERQRLLDARETADGALVRAALVDDVLWLHREVERARFDPRVRSAPRRWAMALARWSLTLNDALRWLWRLPALVWVGVVAKASKAVASSSRSEKHRLQLRSVRSRSENALTNWVVKLLEQSPPINPPATLSWNESAERCCGSVPPLREWYQPGCALPLAPLRPTCDRCHAVLSIVLPHRMPWRCSAAHLLCRVCVEPSFREERPAVFAPLWSSHLAQALDSGTEEAAGGTASCPLCPGDAVVLCEATLERLRVIDANALRWVTRMHHTLFNQTSAFFGGEWRSGREIVHGAQRLLCSQLTCTCCRVPFRPENERGLCLSYDNGAVVNDSDAGDLAKRYGCDLHWMCHDCSSTGRVCDVCGPLPDDVLPLVRAGYITGPRLGQTQRSFVAMRRACLQDCIDWAHGHPHVLLGAAASPLTCARCACVFQALDPHCQPWWSATCDHQLCRRCVPAVVGTARTCPVCNTASDPTLGWKPHTALLALLLLMDAPRAEPPQIVPSAVVCRLSQDELFLMGSATCPTCRHAITDHVAHAPAPGFPPASAVFLPAEEPLDAERPLLDAYGAGRAHAFSLLRAWDRCWRTMSADAGATAVVPVQAWLRGGRVEAQVAWGNEPARKLQVLLPRAVSDGAVVHMTMGGRHFKVALHVRYARSLAEWTVQDGTLSTRLWIPRDLAELKPRGTHVSVAHPAPHQRGLKVPLPVSTLLGLRCAHDANHQRTHDVRVDHPDARLPWHVSVQHWER